jgi:Alkylmercury lyase
MTSIEHDSDAGPADLLAGSCGWANTFERVTVTYAVVGLTNFGEHPVPSTRLAEVLGRPVSEAEALARQWGWPGTRAGDGLITVNPERAKSAARRHVGIGDRRFGMTGCAPDVFLYAPLVRPSLQVEEACLATGTPIRLVFTPSGVESADPAGAVVPILPPQEFDRLENPARLRQIVGVNGGNGVSKAMPRHIVEAIAGANLP